MMGRYYYLDHQQAVNVNHKMDKFKEQRQVPRFTENDGQEVKKQVPRCAENDGQEVKRQVPRCASE